MNHAPITITTPGNIRLTIYPVGTVTVQKADGMVTKAVIKIHGPGEALTYECKETAEEINAMLATTCNPSEADIARRVELLQESCSTSIIVSYGIRDNEYGAIVAGKCYIVTTQLRHHNVFGDDHPTAVWTEASPEVFAAELRRVAIRQLLAERGAK